MMQGRPPDRRTRGVTNGAMGEAGRRLFVAVPLPPVLREFVVAAQSMLPSMPGLRLMHEDQWHVTLAFIGEVGENKAEAARLVVESLPAGLGGEAVIERFLMLPSPRRARVVALELADRSRAFSRLFEAVMSGLEQAGVMEREKRPFRPHLTIARLRDPGEVQPRSECGAARYALESVCLYESQLRPQGALYTVRARTDLT